MTNTKHTPTPWKVEIQPSEGMFQMPRVIKSGNKYLALLGAGKVCYENAQANADFIVRAVNSHEELLSVVEAAKELMTAYRINNIKDLDTMMGGSHWKKLKEAIAKAEGK